MKEILIAEDESISRSLLQRALKKWGYETIVTTNGQDAWDVMQSEAPPALVIVDWMMPGMSGLEFCCKVRESANLASTYLILLTGKRERDDVVTGLQSGANDYVTKPFDKEELHARIQVGERVIELQTALARKVKELEESLSKIKTLQGLIPICSQCKKIRDDQNYWKELESYVVEHSSAEFSYGICPECRGKYSERQENIIQELSTKRSKLSQIISIIVSKKKGGEDAPLLG